MSWDGDRETLVFSGRSAALVAERDTVPAGDAAVDAELERPALWPESFGRLTV
jgi:hypothetical protein